MSRTELTAFDIVLRDGSTLLVRDLTPDDRVKLQHLFAQLSHDSLYFRFFRIPAVDVEITRLFAAGPDDAVLVAETDSRLVAVASWIRDGTKTDRAEVAFAIADVAQGKGIGTALLEALADRGRREGLDKFDAYVLSTNDRMMRVFLDSGFMLSQELDAGVFRVTLALKETPEHETRAAARARTAAAASIKPFFEPRSVAVVGASRERGKIGSELLHNLIATGYTGKLFVVHPSATSIDSVPAYARVTEIPDAIDLALVSVPAGQVAAVVDDCIQKHVRAIVVISAGFSETNEAGRARELELVNKVRRAGIRMVGPNCLGVLNTNPASRLNATFSSVFPPAGAVAMSSQSGALGLAILDWAKRLNIGLSTFISVGNKADVSGNDLLQYRAEDPHTQVILLYLESFGNPRKFSQIARRVARSKPIVAVKAGRSQAGARAAASHTGALVSNDAIVEALFRQCGVIRTITMEELFDVAAVIANQPVPRGPRVGILTNAGGPGILAADACEANGLQLPALADTTCQSLCSFLPTTATIANPVDMIASASAEQYERALTALLADEHVDSVLVIFIPPLVTRGEDVARAIQRAAKTGPDKPVVAVFLSSEPGGPLLAPIPCFAFPEAACVALARTATYGQWRARPAGVVAEFHDFDRSRAQTLVQAVLSRGGGWATPEEAFSLVAAAGISTVAGTPAGSEAAAIAGADSLGYPVVLKASGPAIVHKTERGAVRIGLVDAEAVRHAWRELALSLGNLMTGAFVQRMVTGGVEMLVGAIQDPIFGGVIACASGGVLTELMADRQVRLAPLTDLDAKALIDGLRGAALLHGHRGQPAADEQALAEALLRLSALTEACPEIVEFEINPLRVLAHGVAALDVRARIERPRPRPPTRRVQDERWLKTRQPQVRSVKPEL